MAVPWARARSGFTLLMEALVVTLVRMSGMPVRQVAALLGVTDQRLWRSLEALVDAARAEASMAAVTAVGIDEKLVGRIGVVSVVHAAGSGAVLHLSQGAKAANLGRVRRGLLLQGFHRSILSRVGASENPGAVQADARRGPLERPRRVDQRGHPGANQSRPRLPNLGQAPHHRLPDLGWPQAAELPVPAGAHTKLAEMSSTPNVIDPRRSYRRPRGGRRCRRRRHRLGARCRAAGGPCRGG